MKSMGVDNLGSFIPYLHHQHPESLGHHARGTLLYLKLRRQLVLPYKVPKSLDS
jgi:hypothetical protein